MHFDNTQMKYEAFVLGVRYVTLGFNINTITCLMTFIQLK